MSTIEFTQEELERAPSYLLTRLSNEDAFDPKIVADEVAKRWGVTRYDMLRNNPASREKHLVTARADLYAELRARGWSFPAIGRFCGGRDHTTIISALRTR